MKEFHKNPRLITEDELQKIKKNLEKLGDISCIVHDLNSDEIVGGNQRSRIADINNAEITVTEKLNKPDKQGTVAWGYVNWNGVRLLYRQVKWTKAWCEQANITANSLTGRWDEVMIRNEWKGVPGIENWNLPFVLNPPPLLDNNIDVMARTSNKYHDIKPLIFISFNLVQKQVIVPEEEAKQFLNGIIDLTRNGGDALSLLLSSGILNNDFSPLIKFWYQKNKTIDQAYKEAGENSQGFLHKYLQSNANQTRK